MGRAWGGARGILGTSFRCKVVSTSRLHARYTGFFCPYMRLRQMMMRVRSHCQHVEWEAWKFCIFQFAVCWELQRDRHRHNKQLTCLQDGYFTLASDWAFRSLSVPLDLLLEVCLLHWVITLGAYWRVRWSWVLHMLAFLVQVTGGHSVQRKLTYQTWFLGFPNIVKSCSGRRCVQVGSDPFAQSHSMAKSSH